MVGFPDGRVEEFSTNVIAECLYSQVDQEGNQYLLIDEIIDHNQTPSDQTSVDPVSPMDEQNQLQQSTKGWNLCVLWKDGSTSWESLKDMKNAFPIQVAEYAVARQLHHLPAFAWWVPHTLKKRYCIIKTIKTRYL
jgi:hypothetical protein